MILASNILLVLSALWALRLLYQFIMPDVVGVRPMDLGMQALLVFCALALRFMATLPVPPPSPRAPQGTASQADALVLLSEGAEGCP